MRHRFQAWCAQGQLFLKSVVWQTSFSSRLPSEKSAQATASPLVQQWPGYCLVTRNLATVACWEGGREA